MEAPTQTGVGASTYLPRETMADKKLSYSKLDKVLKTGLHQYEPVATDENTTEDGEIKITEETLWIPMCQIAEAKSKKPDYLLAWEIEAIDETISKFYRLRIAKQFMDMRECHECLVLCFREHLEMLDVMPLRELFPKEDEENSSNGFDFE